MITFPCIFRSLLLLTPEKKNFTAQSNSNHGTAFRIGHKYGTVPMPSLKAERMMYMAMMLPGGHKAADMPVMKVSRKLRRISRVITCSTFNPRSETWAALTRKRGV